MSDLQIIQEALDRAGRRRRWQRAWAGFWQGLLVASIQWLAALALYKIFPLPISMLAISGIVGVVIVLIGFVLGGMRRLTRPEMARWMDEQHRLQQRLSTALEVSGTASESSWKELILGDAAAQVRGIDSRRLLPFHLPAFTRVLLGVLVLSAGLGFVPEYRSSHYLQKQKDRDVIRETGRRLADLTRRSLAQRPPAMEPTAQSMEKLAELGEQMSKAPLTRAETLKQLANVSEKMREELKEIAKNPALKPLEKASRDTRQAGDSGASEMQKQIQALEKAVGEKTSAEALEKLKQELEKAREEMRSVSKSDSSPGAEAARQKMAQALSELAKQAASMGQGLPDLQEAIEALKANQTDLFLKEMEAALTDLERVQQMAKTLEQLQRQAGEKIGKDLAEQLKNGQAAAAQKTLEKMAEQLRQGKISPEQLEKMLGEVAQAIDPAAPYGKAAEHLKNAAEQMKKQQGGNAAKELASAAKELEKLLEQMSDAQSLAGSLEALRKAEVCVGNGKCDGFGPGNSSKGGMSLKPTGKPGSGFGTWTDENGWLFYPEITDRWDNSDANRPDMAPRGLTDRGEPGLADGLVPTEVRGKINPGPMQSVTLKGVSIKGQSKVQYQEAVSAAQSDAQSALNQDQVPRAYQGAVKSYFDDLPK